MALQQKSVQVGEEQVQIQSLTASRATTVAVRIARVLGGIGRGVRDVPESVDELKSSLRDGTVSVGGMIEGLLDNMDPDATPRLLCDIVRWSVVGAQGRVFQDPDAQEVVDWYEWRFAGSLDQLFELVWAILQFNFGEPLEWLKKTVAKQITPEDGSAEPSTSSHPAENDLIKKDRPNTQT